MENQINGMIDLGPCCACGKTGPDVRNIIALHKPAPEPGTGWGCVVCGLPANGAQAVLCDGCLESKAEIKEVAAGYLAEKGRMAITGIDQTPFKHRMEYHPEMLQSIRWFDTSPDQGDPSCICSICSEQIPEPDYENDYHPLVLRLFKKASPGHPGGQEARFCENCSPLVIKHMAS
jgi:hypothetical protein